MKLTYLKISNYRNLHGLEISFHPNNNFIVGENNLGKTNLLNLLNTLFRNTYRTNYELSDFEESDKPIEITFSLLLDDLEIGLFDDLFDSDESENNVTIRAHQPSADEYLEYWHDETGQKIAASTIKCINYLYYDSQRTPIKELTFDKSRGVGRFLNHLVKGYLDKSQETDLDFVDKTKVEELLEEINDVLIKIKAFKDYDINAKLEEEIEDLLARLVLLKDKDDRLLNQSGYGVQFLAVISLFILEKLLDIGKIKSKKGIFGDAENKSISLVVGLDEPEIHLHPFLQRSLIKYLHRVIRNEDQEFLEVMQKAFGLKNFIGQSIIATHSPSIILNNYQELIRLYVKNGNLSVKSGSNLVLSENLQKHLHMQFPYIKEAFFSRCAIVVEGECEIAAFPSFALNMNALYDFDDRGIAVIRAGGKESVIPVIQLLELFDIPAVGIIDRDKDEGNQYRDLSKTTAQDFEEEIANLVGTSGESDLEKVVLNYDSLGKERSLHQRALLKYLDKYSDGLDPVTDIESDIRLSEIAEDDLNLKKLWYLTWLNINKNILVGAIIGETLRPGNIPDVYREIIRTAVQITDQ